MEAAFPHNGYEWPALHDNATLGKPDEAADQIHSAIPAHRVANSLVLREANDRRNMWSNVEVGIGQCCLASSRARSA